jgi:hypothetical protein
LILHLRNRYGQSLNAVRREGQRSTGGGQVRTSKHTIGEVLTWFDGAGLEFVQGVPSILADGGEAGRGKLLEPSARGGKLDHFQSQARQLFTGSRNGGLFTMIARKPMKSGTDAVKLSSNSDSINVEGAAVHAASQV